MMDFDTSRLADPALDVGYFLADWQFWNVTCHAGLEKMQENFLAGYAPGVPKERLMRARLYEAIELVRCAVRRVQLFEHDWAYRTAVLVERAQAVLNDFQFSPSSPVSRQSPKEVHDHEPNTRLLAPSPFPDPVDSGCR
jgi:aminoglycoside phosphotransferase (APT) family kinase protein